MRIPYPLRPRSFLLTLLLHACGLAACGGEPEPALRVGELAFAAEQVAGLEPERLRLLEDLAGLGAAAVAGRADSIASLLARHEADRARLRALPYHLAAREEGIGEERLRAAYAADPEWELRVRHVVRLVPRHAGEEQRAEARRIATEVARRASAGEDFARLAAEHSEEPGAAERGGLLEPGRAGSWVEPFWQAARALEPGEVSPVVETEYGYHVLRLDGRDPVPFEQAARLPILRRLIPAGRAVAAMEAWVERRPPVALDPPAALAARAALVSGAPADSLVLARGPGDAVYTGRDLALAWASTDPEQRADLRADDAAFGRWVENDVREAFWSAEARRLGAEPPPGVAAEAEARWRGRIAGWMAALGYHQGMPASEAAARALAGLGSAGQEARIARAEVPALRPVLRALYPPEGPASSGSSSSSEMRNSESTR